MNWSPAQSCRRVVSALVLLFSAVMVSAGTTGTALVRHAPAINGTVDGSLQQMTGEAATLNGGAMITGDWLVPGTPTIRINGHPSFGGTVDGVGSASPSGYSLTLNGATSLQHIVRRTDPVGLPTVSAPPLPSGTRTVTINSATDAVGNFSTLRNLTLNGNVGQCAIPGGTYGDFIANGGSGFTLGVAGSTEPMVYNFQHLTLNGTTNLQVVGPVIVNIANGFTANGNMGSSQNASWLTLNIYSGAFTLNGGCSLYGRLRAPNSSVIINGGSQLIGALACDRLTVNGRGLVRLAMSANTPPTVSITAPTDGMVFAAPATMLIQASAAASGASIAKVEFFAGATKIGEAAAAPYQISWANAPAGAYALTAVATDSTGQTATSTPVKITVDVPPSVALTAPTANTIFTAPASFTIAATATDTDGTIAKVEFFNGATKLGESTAAPYQFAWSNVTSGSYSLTAVATDDRGISSTSTAVPVVVNALPAVSIISPAPGTAYQAPTTILLQANASDSDGTIAKVAFYDGATLIGETTSAPYQFSWSNVGAGNYSVTAVATDNLGGTAQSAALAIQVASPNVPPTVTLTAPPSGSVLTAPASFTLTANASDSDGSVAKVEFFQNGTTIGVVNAAPYQLAITGLAAGTYSYSARATDNQGATATCAPITVISNAPPAVALTAPQAGTIVGAPANVLIQANASDSDGTVTKVEFFNGATKLGESTSAPYQYNWANVAAGSYTLTAVAVDDHGATATSSAISFTADAPPAITLTAPVDNAIFDAPATVTLSANATDADGSISKVEFFADGTKLGETNVLPYQYVWTGMAAGSHALTARATDNNNITTDSTPVAILVNVPPTVSLTAPTDNSVFVAPASFTLTVDATDSDGTIAKIEFFENGTKIGEATAAPYQLAVSNLAAGAYAFTARATDNVGSTSTSTAVNVISNAPPSAVMTSPADGTIVTAPSVIALAASASDSDGSVAKVEFFANQMKIGEADAAPYTFTWPGVTAGTYSLTARVTDNYGAAADSPAITVIANAPPTVALTSPATGSVVVAPAAIVLSADAADADGSVAKVEFFNGATKLGEALTVPYQLAWNNVPAGNYTLTAVATDNHGATTTSVAAAIVVNSPPTVTLTTPAAGASFIAPATVALAASAADADGTIAKVEFYYGATKLGEATTAPYQFNWTNVAAGNYNLTARAIDNLGAATNSAAVTISVNAPPTVTLTAPANNAFLQPATPLTLTADAADSDGTIAKVEFFNGATKVGESSAPSTLPSTFTVTLPSGLPSGKYTLTARATDNAGASTMSAPTAITINTAPVATPMTIAATPGTAVAVTLMGTDADGTPLTFSITSPPQHGTLSGTSPNLTYTAAADFGGFDSFTFVANDRQLSSSAATVEITSSLPPRSHTYTTTADFTAGNLTGISTDTADQITNRTVLSAFDVIWIANSSKGTVVKLDPETGRALGEYLTAPTGTPSPYPSRVAVDSRGNVWVANMATDSIVKIGLPDSGGWLDRNNNAVTDTSTGLGDVRPWSGTDVTGAADEAILLYVHTGLPAVRQLSIDADDNVWVSAPGGSWLKYDGRTGFLLRSEPSVGLGGNGGFMTDDGTIYSAGDKFLIWNTNNPINPDPRSATVRQGTWEAARDSKGNLWCTRDWTSTVAKYSPTGQLLGEYYHGEPWAMGIAIDANDHVWIAHSHCGHSVGHLLPDGTLVGNVPVANHGPIEVSIDRHGRIWVTSSTGVVERINPLGGPLGSDGVTPVGEVDLHSGNLGGALWTYGRFTGSTKGLSAPDGYWTAVYDGVLSNSTWGPAVWNGLVGNDGRIVVESALSADGVNFTPYETLSVSNPTPGGTGRYLKTRVRLVSAKTGETPVLYDLTVGTTGYGAPNTTKSWYVSAGAPINGNWPDTIQLAGAFWHTAQSFPTEPTYAWSLVSGPGTVTFSNPTIKRPTAQFSAQGTYVLQLTGTLDGVVSTSTVTVTLAPYNRAPYANAGYTTFISSFPPQLWLWGEVRDDGLPVGATVTSTWSKLFGPGTVTFSDPSAASTQASFSTPGVYTLQLSANDTQYTTKDTTDVWIGVPPPPPPPSGLVSWWEASGNGDDHFSGNQAFLEKTADYATGKYGGAFRFNGSTSRVHVFASPSIDVGVQDGTSIEFWMNPSSTSANSTLLEFGQGTTRGVHVRQLNNALEVDFRDRSGGDHLLTTGGVLTNGTWTHVAATYDHATGEARVFVNGIIQARTNVGPLLLSTGYDLFMGERADTTESYNGLLDDVTLYSRAIYADEVTTIVTQGKRPPVSNLAPVVSAGPNLFNQHVNMPVTLNGTVTDDGQPTNGALTSTWSLVTGPGTVTFANPSQVQTTATFSAPGLYTLNLRGDDGAFYTDSTVEVRVDAYGTVETDSSLVAWWPANGSDLDTVNGLKAERFHGTSYTAGMPEQAFSFDGANDFAKVGAAPALNVGSSSAGFTIEMWVKPTVLHDTPLIEWERADGNGDGVSLWEYYGGAGLYGRIIDQAGANHQIDTGSNQSMFAVNTWSHVALTYDRTTGFARLYRNSILVAELNVGFFAPMTSYPVIFGARVREGRFFQGAMDEVSLYSRPLSTTEISAIYQAAVTGKNPRDGNRPPTVQAGADTSGAAANTAILLNGLVSDDSKPTGGNTAVTWTTLSGPGNVTFANPNAATTSATFSANGTYVLQLAANDGYKAGASDVSVVRVGVPGTFETDASLAAWWPGNADRHDVVHGHDVELYNGMGYGAGEVAEAFTFDGVNDHGRVAAHSDLDVGASSAGFTIEMWVNPAVLHDTPLIEWERADGNADGVSLWENYGGAGLYAHIVDQAGTNHQIDTGSNQSMFAANTWSHVAVTYDRTTGYARLYRNGVLVGEQNLGVFTPLTSYPIVFGARIREGRYFQGALDEISVFSRPLTVTEITAIYKAGAVGKNALDGNVPPVVNAGADVQAAAVGSTVILSGSVTDDGKPVGSTLTAAWTKLDGPGNVTFANSAAAATSATFDAAGTYILGLTGSDGAKQSSDVVVARVGTPGSVQTDAFLAAWWPANGDSHEVVHGHDAELYNGATFGAGEVSEAFVFNGSNSHARVAASSDLDVGRSTSGLTIEMWVRPTALHDTPLVEWERVDGNADGVSLWENYGGAGLYAHIVDQTGTNHQIDTGSNQSMFAVNTWSHVAVTYDKSTGYARLYRNSVLVAESYLGQFTPQTSYPVMMGARLREGRYFQGALDEISIYSRPLSVTEITAIYQAGATGKNPLNSNQPPTVSAGPDTQIANVSSVATLAGSISDDGQPTSSTLVGSWSKVDGPGNVAFADFTSASTTATFDTAGTYILQLTGYDGAAQASDRMLVRVGTTGSVEPDGGLVAWWPANGDPHEVVHGHDVELYNNATYGPGMISQAFVFNGTNSHGRVAASSDLDVGQSPAGLTIEMWVKPTALHDTPLIEWERADGNADGLSLWENWGGGGLYAHIVDQAGTNHQIDTGSNQSMFAANAWSHIAVTYDKTTGFARLYRNAILVAETNVGVFSPLTSYPLVLGSRIREGRYFQGALDEISIYNRPLSITEISAIYNAGAVGKNPVDDNQPPVTIAGGDVQVLGTTAAATLNGSVVDDGKPVGSVPTAAWVKVDGPGNVTFANAASAATTATFDQTGTYILRLTGTDGITQSADTAVVRVGTPGGYQTDAALAAWWPGNGSPLEVVHGDNLEAYNGVGYGPGKVSEAFMFSGSGFGRAATSSNVDIGASTQGFTIELWANPSVLHDTPLIEWERADGAADGVSLWENYGGAGLYAYIVDTNGTNHQIDTGSNQSMLPANTWSHVAITYDRVTGYARLFRNGVMVAERNLGLFAPRTSYPLVFGSRVREGRYFQGAMDEVALYTRPLSMTEITSIYQAGYSGKNSLGSNQPPSVSAGPDLTLTNATDTALLNGVVLDDTRPGGAGVNVVWSKLDGPGTVVFGNLAAAATTATFSTAGTYVLELDATDGAAHVSDTVVVRAGVAGMTPSATNLAAWWPGNGDTHEVVHGGHDLELYNGTTFGSGEVSEGFVFDGSNDHGRIGAHADLDIGASDAGFTVELWAKPSTVHDTPLIEWERADGNADGLSVWENYGGRGLYAFLVDAGGTNHQINTGSDQTSFAPNAWTHVALTYDKASGVACLYANGRQVAQSTLGSFKTQTTYPIVVGSRIREGRYFQGTLDEITLYSRALSAAEVTAVYQAGAAGKLPPVTNAAPAVVLTAPASGSGAVVNTAVSLTALAADTDGSIAKVEFFDGATKLGEAVTADAGQPTSYTLNLANGFATPGRHVITAVASDNAGGVSNSSVVLFNATQLVPIVSVTSPGNYANVSTGVPVTLAATATYAAGAIAKVEFYDSGLKLGESTAPTSGATYTFTVNSGFGGGTHYIAANAIAVDGTSVISTPVGITATVVRPIISWIAPAANTTTYNGATLTLQASATYAAGVISKVEFYDGTTKLGEATTADTGTTATYSLVLPTGLALGNRAVSARAIAADGAVSTTPQILLNTVLASPSVAISNPANNANVATGSPLTITASASQPSGTIAKVEYFDNGTKLGETTTADSGSPTSFSFVASGGLAAGTHALTAKATATNGQSSLSAVVTVKSVAYSGPPVVELMTPIDTGRISRPTAVTGVVANSALASWTVEYRLKAAEGATPDAWTTLATGTSLVGTVGNNGAADTAGTFCTFDPTSLINGIYELQLRMTDIAGTTSFATADPITVIVEGNMKIGVFSLAFEDMKVPVAGIPITVTRTYDSRDVRVGDFGPGWRIAVANVRVQKNRNLGAGWYQTPQSGDAIQFYNVDPVGDRIVTVTMPDGETHRFKIGALVKNRPGDPDDASYAVVVTQGTLKFYPIGDTTSTLEPLDANNQLASHFYIDGTGDQDLRADDPQSDPFAATYNATRFRLTTKDGTAYIVDEKIGLLQITDLNGNTLVVNRDAQNRVTSVVSTLGTGASAVTSSVTIHRDATGRVDYVQDPAGNSVDYLYDTQGRLASFTDRTLNVTQFFYENASFPYYLTRIVDPRGVNAIRSEYDTNGKLIKQIDASGKETRFDPGVDTTGEFQKVTDRLGNVTTFYYDDRGNVTLKIDPLGGRTTYAYYPDSDRVKFETDHYGNIKSMAYDARGNVLVETTGANTTEDPANPTTGHTTRTTYNAQSQPTQITDADGRVQTFTYDATTGNLLSQTTGAGGTAPATTTFTYNTDGTLSTQTDALGNVTGYTYNYAFSDPAYPGAVKQISVTVTDPAGAAGSDPANAADTVLRSTRTLYDAQENQLAQVVTRHLPDGSSEDIVTRYVYDSENRPTATIMPDGRVTETRYNSFGKDDKVVQWQSVADYLAHNDGAGRVTSYGYDSRGNQTSITYPDGTSEQTHFDAENRKDWSQDRRGYRTFFVYDAVGRLDSTIFPDADDGTSVAAPTSATDSRLANNPRTETVYDLAGRVTDSYDEMGRHSQTVYYPDGSVDAGRRKQQIQVRTLGNLVTTYQYDGAGNVRFVTDPRGNTVETQYDDQGRPTKVLYPATDENAATQTTTTYDLLGRRTAVTDQEGKITRYRYDGLGRLVEVRQYLDQSLAASDADFHLSPSNSQLAVTSYTYDEAGNQVTQTDALGRTTTYWTDNTGRRTKRVLPGSADVPSATENLTYDGWGNLWKRTDFAGKTTTFLYDTLNRLTSKSADPTHPSLSYTNAIARVEYDYDANGARKAARTYNGANTLLYSETTSRDERGRVSYKDTAGGRLSYTYYANNLLNDVVSSNASGVNVGYRYDEVNRLETVDDGTTGTVRTSSFTYNANGSLETVTQPNTVVHTYNYDALNRLRGLIISQVPTSGSPPTILHTYEYKLNPSGHRRQVIEGTRTTTYGYDALYRLTSESIAGDSHGNDGTITYTLDKVGNRLSRSSSVSALGSQPSLTYNARDQLSTDTYDANGNTVTGQLASGSGAQPSGTDVYDFENRLIVRTKSDGTSVNISYDADGNRTQKNLLDLNNSPVSATTYLVDTNNLTGYAQVVEERRSVPTGVTLKVYTYGNQLLSCATTLNNQPAVLSYYTFDGHGNVRELTDSTGTVTDRYDYDAFGNVVLQSGSTTNNYLYCGEQYDPDLGLYYNRARYLNTDSGRFWSMDKFAGRTLQPTSLHKYLYAWSDPITHADASGLDPDIASTTVTTGSIGILARIAIIRLVSATLVRTTVTRGAAFVASLGASMLARGIVTLEQDGLLEEGEEALTRCRFDLLVQKANEAGQRIAMLVEGKGVPWFLSGSGWQNFLNAFARQAGAYSRALQVGGQAISQRVIIFSSQVPPGMEQKWSDVQKIAAANYDKVFTSQAEFEAWLDTL